MEEAVRSLQTQVEALHAQNATLHAELVRQPAVQPTIQQIAESLPTAIATALGRTRPERRTLIDVKGLGKPPVFWGKEEDFYVWAKKVENYVAGVYPNVRASMHLAVETETEIRVETLVEHDMDLSADEAAEIDAQLFVVLSSLTDGETFDIVASAGGGCGYEGWRKLHKRWDPYTAGRARSLLRDILSPPRSKLHELMGAIERLEDLTRRYCSRRDAQGKLHSLAEEIRMSSLEALLPEDLENMYISTGHGGPRTAFCVWRS